MFTAAHPGQGGVAHVNEQPKSYWANRFARHGLRRSDDLEARFLSTDGDVWGGWLLENLMIFQR